MPQFKINPLMIIGIIVVAIIGYKFWDMSSEIEDLQDKVDGLIVAKSVVESAKSDAEAESARLLTIVSKQNNRIAVFKLDQEKLLTEFEEWKSKPPVIKYRDKKIVDIREIVKKVEVESDICKQIKPLLNKLRGLRYENFK